MQYYVEMIQLLNISHFVIPASCPGINAENESVNPWISNVVSNGTVVRYQTGQLKQHSHFNDNWCNYIIFIWILSALDMSAQNLFSLIHSFGELW